MRRCEEFPACLFDISSKRILEPSFLTEIQFIQKNAAQFNTQFLCETGPNEGQELSETRQPIQHLQVSGKKLLNSGAAHFYNNFCSILQCCLVHTRQRR